MAGVVIAGAGLAGLAAGVRLGDAGHRVTVLERLQTPGGRVRHIPAPGDGQRIDWGQHLLLGAYHSTLTLANHLGTRDLLVPVRGATPFVSPGGRVHPYRTGGLPGPLHALPGLLALTQIPLRDRIGLAAPALDARRRSARSLRALDERTAADWLRGLGQREATLRLFWEPVTLATLNTPLEEASAALLAVVLTKGVLSSAADAAPLLPSTSLHDLLVGPACDRIRRLGGQILPGRPAKGLVFNGARVAGVLLEDGAMVGADVVILALPPWHLAPLLREGTPLADLQAGAREFAPSEIVSQELWYDRDWLPHPYAGLLEGTSQWVFRHHPDGAGRHRISVVISAADVIDVAPGLLAAHVASELPRYFPGAARARVLAEMTIREPRATFRAMAGLARHRPGARTRSPNVFLAGDWCDTGLPATIEGAIRSGFDAADAASRAIETTP